MADETFFLLDGTQTSLSQCLDTMELFGECSGLKVNVEKNKAVWLGIQDVRANCYCASLLRTNIHATSSMSARALSIKINNDREDGHCCSFAWI